MGQFSCDQYSEVQARPGLNPGCSPTFTVRLSFRLGMPHEKVRPMLRHANPIEEDAMNISPVALVAATALVSGATGYSLRQPDMERIDASPRQRTGS